MKTARLVNMKVKGLSAFMVSCAAIAIVLLTVEEAKYFFAPLAASSPINNNRLKDCHNVYLDVGSNIGVQVRKLFEPHLFPKADTVTMQLFEKAFGTPEQRRTAGFLCAFGFEGNPEHAKGLKELETCYVKKGWKTYFNVPVVVAKSVNPPIVSFYKDNDSANMNWGATTFGDTKSPDQIKFDVPTFDLADFVLNVIETREQNVAKFGAPTVYMKMDIEGSEYEVLGSMLLRGALKNIDITTVEVHPSVIAKGRPLWHHKCQEYFAALKTIFSMGQTFYGFKAMYLLENDDESYVNFTGSLPCGKGTMMKNVVR